jgi:lysozyme family protein
MSKPIFEALRDEYSRLWQGMKIHDDKIAFIDRIAARLGANKSRYQAVSEMTTVPWYVIATVHEREASGNFHCHLHNGDPLSARTRHVPSGRPPAPAQPPFTWEQSAADALTLDGLTAVGSWSVERACYEIELYNGFGYRQHGINSPYLWSFSNNYSSGKYVQDGHWSASAADAQCGVMPLIARMMVADLSITFDNVAPTSGPTHTTDWLQAALNSLGTKPELIVDGDYGSSTKGAVRDFQMANGLQDDGVAGPITCTAIEKKLSALSNTGSP